MLLVTVVPGELVAGASAGFEVFAGFATDVGVSLLDEKLLSVAVRLITALFISVRKLLKSIFRAGKKTSVNAGDKGNTPPDTTSLTWVNPSVSGQRWLGPMAFAWVNPKLAGAWQPAQVIAVARAIVWAVVKLLPEALSLFSTACRKLSFALSKNGADKMLSAAMAELAKLSPRLC